MKRAILATRWQPAVGGVEGERGCFPEAPALVATAAGAASTEEAGGTDAGAGAAGAGAGGPLGPSRTEVLVAWRVAHAAWRTLIKEGGGCTSVIMRIMDRGVV